MNIKGNQWISDSLIVKAAKSDQNRLKELGKNLRKLH